MSEVTSAKSRYVSGARKIAQVIDRTPRAIYHLYETGRLPGASKVGGVIVLDTVTFHERTFGAECAA
jgi:hypothetical protein